MRFHRKTIQWACLLSFLSILSCGEDRHTSSLGVIPGLLPNTSTLPPSPLGTRQNPLQLFIRNNWTGEDTSSVGGSVYDHIKTYGHNYTNLSSITGGATQAQFVADHFDAYMWGGSIVGSTGLATNPDFLWVYEIANTPYIRVSWDSSQAEGWLNDPVKNESGYTWLDLALYYKWDSVVGTGSTAFSIPGWNPADDPDSSGCRDAAEGNGGAPSDPQRSAVCKSDAQAREYNRSRWIVGNVVSPARVEMTAEVGVDYYLQHGMRGVHFDEVAYEGGTGVLQVLGNTFTYEGMDAGDPSFAYPVDRLFLVPSVMEQFEQQTGDFIHFGNMVSPRYTCGNVGPHGQQDAALAYLENTFNELWMESGGSWNYLRIPDYLNCPLVNWMEQGKGYIFACLDEGDTDRARLFSLATFYMINQQMAFYYYRTRGHSSPEGTDVADWQWNPFVEFDIGQPTTNTQNLSDFQNNTGTTKYFVWATNSNYQILGREYLRADGQRTLVLAKMMAIGLAEGANSTSHTLPKRYKRLTGMPGVFATPSCSVTLANNQGVILVEVEDCSSGGGGGKKDPQG